MKRMLFGLALIVAVALNWAFLPPPQQALAKLPDNRTLDVQSANYPAAGNVDYDEDFLLVEVVLDVSSNLYDVDDAVIWIVHWINIREADTGDLVKTLLDVTGGSVKLIDDSPVNEYEWTGDLEGIPAGSVADGEMTVFYRATETPEDWGLEIDKEYKLSVFYTVHTWDESIFEDVDYDADEVDFDTFEVTDDCN